MIPVTIMSPEGLTCIVFPMGSVLPKYRFAALSVSTIEFKSLNAVFALPERKHRLEVTNAASWLLPNIVGTVAAEEMIASGRRFDAAEALGFGLIEEVVDAEILLTAAEERARKAEKRSRLRSLTEDELETILLDESSRVLSAARQPDQT